MRKDGRLTDQLRPIKITPHYTRFAEGSALIEIGNTKVLCNVTIEHEIPSWMKRENIVGGWLTAEYSMLPRATLIRTKREIFGLKGRTQEIRRLIGRSLRAAVDLEKLGSRTIIVDCDVLQADGGTRTASITGGYIALGIAIKRLIEQKFVPADIIAHRVAAVSVGIVKGVPLLDLDYSEDHLAEVDANIVMIDHEKYIEIQSTAEKEAFSKEMLDHLLELAKKGIEQLSNHQDSILNRMQ